MDARCFRLHGEFLALAFLGILGLVACLSACSSGDHPRDRLRLATTTSTENSGLLDELLPVFREATGIDVEVLSMGTGKALATGERGDCDVVLVHAPAAERAFVAAGHGVERVAVMHNDFVILGPLADPAGVRDNDLVDALRAIAASGAAFCSRGDDSGTHKKELALWSEAELDPVLTAAGYIEVGQGMGATLTQAGELGAYTLADRGTYLSYRARLALVILVEGDPRLRNPYGVIAVNPERHPHVNHEGAQRFIEWLTSEETQRRIGDFRIGGEPLFHASAIR